MRIIITGALGHIGSYLINHLPSIYPDAEIIMMDNLMGQRYYSLFNLPRGKFLFLEKDILTTDLHSIFQANDIVIHLAALVDPTNSFNQPQKVEEYNYSGTEKVAQACREKNCRLIFASSTSVYTPKGSVIDETCLPEELKPESPYAKTKLKEEALLNSMSELKYVICRLGTICGISPGMHFRTAVNKFCWQAVMNQPITVWKTALHQLRPYLDIQDAFAAMRFILDKEMFNKSIYNVVTDNYTVNDILSIIRKYIPLGEIIEVEAQIMNEFSFHITSEKLKNEGFTFSGDIEKCIEGTINLLKQSHTIQT